MSFFSPEVRIPRILTPVSLKWEDFEKEYGGGIEPKDISNVAFAWGIAKEAHKRQLRDTGEGYFSHCVMALIYSMEAGVKRGPLLWAALLHDVPEDNLRYLIRAEARVVRANLREGRENDVFDIHQNGIVARFFDQETSNILKAVTKRKIKPRTPAGRERLEKGYSRQLLAGPPNAWVLKAADNLHNLRTLPLNDPARIERKIIDIRRWYIPIFERAAEEFPIEGTILLREINEELSLLEKSV